MTTARTTWAPNGSPAVTAVGRMRPDASRRPAPTGSPGPARPGRQFGPAGVPPPAPVAPVHLGGVLRGSADHQVLEATQPVVAAAVPVLEGRGAACTSCTHAGLGGITPDTARKDLAAASWPPAEMRSSGVISPAWRQVAWSMGSKFASPTADRHSSPPAGQQRNRRSPSTTQSVIRVIRPVRRVVPLVAG